jgi:hypothetical protein
MESGFGYFATHIGSPAQDQPIGANATHTAASLEEALPLVQEATWGTMANKVIMTMGVGDGQAVGIEPARRAGRT